MDIDAVPGSHPGSIRKPSILPDSGENGSSDAPVIARPSAAVTLSDRGRRADAQRAVLEEALAGINARFAADDAFAEAGRADYLSSVANPTDLSAQASAGRILAGITGYIYGGFALANGEIDAEKFATFKSQVLEGFDRGMSEARKVLGAIEVLDPELSGEIAETERLVRKGLDEFFATEEQRLG